VLAAQHSMAVNPPEYLAASATNFSLIVPLIIACVAIIIAIPVAAAQSRLHIPGYVGVAFLTFALALLSGRLSGARRITGTPAGTALSLLFFLLFATAVGSVLALFFYRDAPQS
jgi:lysylphosphatidylglycerol synthetase-like protein (DUF2156 family)